MTIKMIAAKRYYSRDEGKEYEKGAPFFVATEREADHLERMQRARRAAVIEAPLVETTRPASAEVASQAADAAGEDELDTLRKDYEAKTGTAPDMRWGAGRLKTKISALGGSAYLRRDMRAED